ncbi:MAG: 6-bladed beta-propeller [Candidatus Doudnabacteria bacterium]|nr:6-bladed beta-propeller [Candidatus Doudnabacteria bacterium]
MARLDTQINQIYYLPADTSQVSLILIDEVLNNNSHLFVIADLVKIQKRTESTDLKRISEIILTTFQENKKLTGESLFETSLAAINQELADLAHSGKKSWLGKFSALVVLKTSDNIFLANTGQMTAMLYRSGEFLEILNPEKRGLHPLKTFSNFTSGKLKGADILLLTSSNLFNYVALQNLNRMMAESSDAAQVSERVSKILKDTAGDQEGFASFFVTLSKATAAATIPAETTSQPLTAPEQPAPEPEPVPEVMASKPKPTPEPIRTPASESAVESMIYAPAPAKVPLGAKLKAAPSQIFGKIPKFSLPKFNFHIPKLGFWQQLSAWAKFFLVSFLIFLILFASNIVVYAVRKHRKQTVSQSQQVINQLDKNLQDAESALIYRNQDQALKLLTSIQSELASLKDASPAAYTEYQPKVSDLANRINHITVVNNPTTLLTLKHPATELARAGKGFVIADQSTGNVTTYNTSASDASGKDLFLLNKIGEIRGLVNVPNTGNVVITSSEMYLIDTAQSQFSLLHVYPKTDLSRLRFLSPDRLYTIDRTANQIYRIIFSKQTQNAPVPLLKASVDTSKVVDLGVDTDVYLLSATSLKKYTTGNLTSFSITQPTDELTSANRLFVANNLYILEAAKKRLLIYNKQGALVTQIFFPNATDMKDFYVDEQSRNIYILDSNKLLSITF